MTQFIRCILKDSFDIALSIPFKYALIHGQPLIFSLASSESENPIELTFASISHFLNFTKAMLDNKTDQLTAKPISYITGKNEYLSPNNILTRNFIRIHDTFQKNGGVYKEYLIATRLFSPDYDKYNLNKIVTPKKMNGSQQEEETKNELAEIFKASIFDFKHPFFNNFQIIQMELGADMPYTVLSGFLNKQKITLYFDKPRKRMMRKLDLLPFKAIYHITKIVPPLRGVSSDLKSIIDRLDYDINKEYKSRMKLLNVYGIQTEGRDFKDILCDVSSSSLPFAIGVPIKEYTTKHIMITSGLDTMKLNIGYMLMPMLWSFELKDIMIPNLSFHNVRQTETGKPSLISYSSLVFQKSDVPIFVGMPSVYKYQRKALQVPPSEFLATSELYGNCYDYDKIFDCNFTKTVFSNVYNTLKGGLGIK